MCDGGSASQLSTESQYSVQGGDIGFMWDLGRIKSK